jgi:hypothetical protein
MLEIPLVLLVWFLVTVGFHLKWWFAYYLGENLTWLAGSGSQCNYPRKTLVESDQDVHVNFLLS